MKKAYNNCNDIECYIIREYKSWTKSDCELAYKHWQLTYWRDRAKELATSKMQKDYTPQRAYETQVAANIESAGKLKSFEKPNINQKFPRATAEYDTYILRNLRATNDPTGKMIAANNAGFVPFDPKTQTFNYNEMMPGIFYYDPRRGGQFVQRIPESDDDEGGIFIYDKNTFKKRKFEK